MSPTWRWRGECPTCGVEPQARCLSLRGTGTLTVVRPHPARPLMTTTEKEAWEAKHAS